MKTRMLLLLGCTLMLSSNVQATSREMWVWKDANGVTHYSDVPAPGAKRITIAGSSPGSPPPPATTTSDEGATRPERAPVTVQYDSLGFTVPEEGATFFAADASIEVQVTSNPMLAKGDRLLVYLDGRQVDAAENSYQHMLTGLDRGVHMLTAVILDQQGNEKISSAPRNFSVRIDAADNPRNVGPALKPQPAPRPAPTPAPAPPKSNK
jgi:hypothetical protein